MEKQALKTEAGTLILRPARGWMALNLLDLWKYRELLYFLTWRDIKVRYKQAALGVAWAILQPIMTMIIFSVILGYLLGVPTDNDIPYPVFSFVALLPWQLFASALQRTGVSLVGNANLLTKVYFPRLVIPVSAVGAGLVDFLISFVVLIGLMLFYKIELTWNVLWLPLLVLLALLTAVAVGLWLAALNVQYRDVQQMIPFIIQAWFYASPVVYSSTIIPSENWQLVYALNPMAGVIQGFRWALLGTQAPDASLAVSSIVVLLLLVSGLYFFKRMERTFADIV
ncbi:MAG: ABC transporter permease [Anaerolineales bacterium]|nr:ABC transporter permease [Anaerolineales bacterium]